MKKKGESEDAMSSNSKSISKPPPSPKTKEVTEFKEDQSMDFSNSVNEMLARKRNENLIEKVWPQQIIDTKYDMPLQQPPVFPIFQNNNDMVSIKAFFDNVKNSLSGSYNRNQGNSSYTSSEGKNIISLYLFDTIKTDNRG